MPTYTHIVYIKILHENAFHSSRKETFVFLYDNTEPHTTRIMQT